MPAPHITKSYNEILDGLKDHRVVFTGRQSGKSQAILQLMKEDDRSICICKTFRCKDAMCRRFMAMTKYTQREVMNRFILGYQLGDVKTCSKFYIDDCPELLHLYGRHLKFGGATITAPYRIKVVVPDYDEEKLDGMEVSLGKYYYQSEFMR